MESISSLYGRGSEGSEVTASGPRAGVGEEVAPDNVPFNPTLFPQPFNPSEKAANFILDECMTSFHPDTCQ